MNKKIGEYGLIGSFVMTGRLPYSPLALLPFDLLISTSREDPYPLVVIEAAYLKMPTIAFAGSGGATEFIADECGWLIPDFSTNEFIRKIEELQKNPDNIKERGYKAYYKAIRLHSNEEIILDEFRKIIKALNL